MKAADFDERSDEERCSLESMKDNGQLIRTNVEIGVKRTLSRVTPLTTSIAVPASTGVEAETGSMSTSMVVLRQAFSVVEPERAVHQP